ncbi:hypothetical protein ACFO5O_05065 [Geojedonia litorea]|uniref:Lipocalin-like domain-containing protein n=1 Tax=Geojedonia litorea TaxID=1268269 RepID=A0ABV9N2M4_9FLAO
MIGISCQDSITETIEKDEVNQLSANTNLSNLLGRVALNDGSKDNIIDRANNISIVLPITVIVNGIEINITSVSDYQLVENAIEAFPDDNDIINIIFPIDIILPDYTRVTISNQAQFDFYVNQSTEDNEIDEDLECIDFKYPISFEALAFNASIPTTIVITNDAELYELIENLDNFASVNFNFPITLVTFENIEIAVTDLDALESAIENTIDICDEDDDFDFNDDDEAVLFDFLTRGDWIIDEYSTDEEEFTEDYNGYIFTFESAMSVSSVNDASTVSGTWTIDNTDPNNLLVVLDFGAVMPHSNLNESWKITNLEADSLSLEIGSESNGDLKVLVFEKL